MTGEALYWCDFAWHFQPTTVTYSYLINYPSSYIIQHQAQALSRTNTGHILLHVVCVFCCHFMLFS